MEPTSLPLTVDRHSAMLGGITPLREHKLGAERYSQEGNRAGAPQVAAVDCGVLVR